MLFEAESGEISTGKLRPEKLDAIVEVIADVGYAVVADLVSEQTRQILHESVIEDAETMRASGELTQHEQRTAPGHLQLGGRRYAPYVCADFVANPLIECVVNAVLGDGAWLGFYNGNVNCPGSGVQPLHYDRPYSWRTPEAAAAAGVSWPPPPTTLSCSVALSAITQATGATEIYPGSHRETAVAEWKPGDRPGKHPEVLAKWDCPAAMEIPAGGICFRDPRMWHRGVSNPSDSIRPMMALTYHSGLAKHWRGLLVRNLAEADAIKIAGDPVLKVLDDGGLGDGRLVFHESSREAFAEPSLHNIDRNVRFVEAQVDHMVDAHLRGGARVIA